jgi:hypothetical protein
MIIVGSKGVITTTGKTLLAHFAMKAFRGWAV